MFSGWAPNGGIPEAEQMLALWQGPSVELVLEPTASTTAENAARTLPLLVDRSIRHAVIVCAPLHLYRARWFFRRLYSARGIETSFTTPTALPLPSALVWGTVRENPIRNGVVSATASVAVFDWSPLTAVWRGGQDAASRTTHDRGSRSTPLGTPYRYRVNQ